MKKITNFFKPNNNVDKCSKTLNGSKVDKNRFGINHSITSHFKFFISEYDIELQLKFQLDQLATNQNLQKLVNCTSYLNKAIHFFRHLTPQFLANENILLNFEYRPYIHNLKILLFLLKDGTKIYFKEQNGRNLKEDNLDRNDKNINLCRKKAELFMALTKIFAYISYYSKIFRCHFNTIHENTILEVLTDKSVLFDCLKIINKEIPASQHVSDFLKNGVEFLSNLNKSFDKNSKKIFKICESILKFSEMTDEFIIPSLIFVKKYRSQAVNSHTQYFFKKLIEEIVLISNLIGHSERTFPIYFDSKRKSPISIYSIKNLYMNIIELLDTLFYLIDDMDTNNSPIEYELNPLMKNIILNGNEYEAEYAVRVLFRLTFIKNYQLSDLYLKSMLKQIIIYKYSNKNLIRYCESVLWMCEREEKTEQLNTLSLVKNKKIKAFILYDPSNYEICSLIENQLKQVGLMVWFKDINEYSFEKTLLAILSSDVILLVLNNEICHNLNSRLEYEFSLNLNKKILPLVTDSLFSPRSWVTKVIDENEILNLSRLSYEMFKLNLIDSITKLTA